MRILRELNLAKVKLDHVKKLVRLLTLKSEVEDLVYS
jgi:hypothetical protein